MLAWYMPSSCVRLCGVDVAFIVIGLVCSGHCTDSSIHAAGAGFHSLPCGMATRVFPIPNDFGEDLFPTPALANVWVDRMISDISDFVCLSVCLCVRGASDTILVTHATCMAVAQHALTLRSKGQRWRSHGYQMRCRVCMSIGLLKYFCFYSLPTTLLVQTAIGYVCMRISMCI